MVSWVWNYFEDVSRGKSKEQVRCKVIKPDGRACERVIQCKGGSTSGMTTHLKLHKIEKPNSNSGNNINSASTSQTVTHQLSSSQAIDEPPQKRQKRIDECFVQATIEEKIAKEVVMNNMNFTQVARSEMIREGSKAKFPSKNFPSDKTGVTRMVNQFYNSAKEETIKKIQKLVEAHTIFSTTLDGWSSIAGRRYLNVNIHYNFEGNPGMINLGMVPIRRKGSAEKIFKMVR